MVEEEPFDGIFGDTAIARVLEEFASDPDMDYSLADLAKYTDMSAPAIKKVLVKLLSKNLIKIKNKNIHRPVYEIDKNSKRFFALTLLSLAILDDTHGTALVDNEISNYSGVKINFEVSRALEVRTGSSATTSAQVQYQRLIVTPLQRVSEQVNETKQIGMSSA